MPLEDGVRKLGTGPVGAIGGILLAPDTPLLFSGDIMSRADAVLASGGEPLPEARDAPEPRRLAEGRRAGDCDRPDTPSATPAPVPLPISRDPLPRRPELLWEPRELRRWPMPDWDELEPRRRLTLKEGRRPDVLGLLEPVPLPSVCELCEYRLAAAEKFPLALCWLRPASSVMWFPLMPEKAKSVVVEAMAEATKERCDSRLVQRPRPGWAPALAVTQRGPACT